MTTTQQTATALRAQAAQHRQDSADSFDRCDTDGFVSQWASDMNAIKADKNARIADHGGMWTFRRLRLTDLDGNVIEDARQVQTRYGMKWRSDSLDLWAPVAPARVSTLAKRGVAEVEEFAVAPATAIHWSPSGARGISGATSVQTIIIRTDAEKSDGWRPYGEPEA